MRGLIFAISLVIGINSFAQEQSFKVVDANMYELYTKESWKELVEMGEENPFDYYYFNVRMGIAKFNLKRYFEAEKYLNKALKNNETDFAKKYLFWSYLNMGEEVIAEQIYNQLSETAKGEIEYTTTFIESIYVEGGLKKPSTNKVGKTVYGIVALEHRLGNKIRMNHSYNLFSQNRTGSELDNKQYNFFGAYSFNTSSIGAGATIAKSNLNESYPDSIETPVGDTILGNTEDLISSSTQSFYLNYSYRLNRFKINTNLHFVTQSTSFSYEHSIPGPPGPPPPPGFPPPPRETITTEVDSSISRTAIIPSVGLYYTPKIFGDRVTIGADAFAAMTNDKTYFIIKPTLNVSITDRLWVNASYFQTKEHLFADYSTGILYNNLYLSVNRFASTVSFLINPKLTTNLTFTSEKFDDSFENINYTTNSIFLGIHYKF